MFDFKQVWLRKKHLSHTKKYKNDLCTVDTIKYNIYIFDSRISLLNLKEDIQSKNNIDTGKK